MRTWWRAGAALQPLWRGRAQLPGSAAGTHECAHCCGDVRVQLPPEAHSRGIVHQACLLAQHVECAGSVPLLSQTSLHSCAGYRSSELHSTSWLHLHCCPQLTGLHGSTGEDLAGKGKRVGWLKLAQASNFARCRTQASLWMSWRPCGEPCSRSRVSTCTALSAASTRSEASGVEQGRLALHLIKQKKLSCPFRPPAIRQLHASR